MDLAGREQVLETTTVGFETAPTLRLVFKLPLRQAEGFLRWLPDIMGLSLDVPDHTTLSRCSGHLGVRLPRLRANEPMPLIIDSPGLSLDGEGEWAAPYFRPLPA